MALQVTSEIGRLQSVLIHLPGPEIDRMIPSMMEELLFDDILYGQRAREEHRRFPQVLGFVAGEVLDVEQLLEEVLADQGCRDAVLGDLGRSLGGGPDMDYPPPELLLSGYVFERQPRFARPDGVFWFREFSADLGRPTSYARMRPTLEGGDILVLREDVLAIGYSERTEKTTIERLAEALKAKKSH